VFSIVYLINDELQFPNGVRFGSRDGSGGLWKGLMVLVRTDAGESWRLSCSFLGSSGLTSLSRRPSILVATFRLLAEGDFDIWVGGLVLGRFLMLPAFFTAVEA
jgi:hypothetical protein